MWKPLSVISGLLLLAAGGIMFTQVQYPLRSERAQAEAAKQNLALANKNHEESRKARSQSDNDLADAKKELEANSKQKADTLVVKEKKTSEMTDTTGKRDSAAKELADLDAKLKDLGGLEVLVAALKDLETKKASLDSNIANTKGAIEATIAHKAATDKVIAHLKLREIYQRTGTLSENFRTYVSAVNPELGYVVLAHGNASNVTRGAKLDITRGGTPVARVNVTRIEQNRAIAEIVPGSLAAGDNILPGDKATVNAGSTPKALAAMANKAPAKPGAKKPEAGADPAKPDAAAPPTTDPFAAPDGAAPPMEKPATPPAEKPATPPAENPAAPPAEKPSAPPAEKPAGDPAMTPEKKAP